ncbi:MAG: tyrosine recombinase XerC [Pseudomonadota bacterium]|jgi:integrase/recombinase XerC
MTAKTKKSAAKKPAVAKARVTDARLAAFAQHLLHERRLSPLTAKHYGRDVEALLALSADTPLEKLTTHHIRRYTATLHGRGLSGKSLRRMLSGWRGFFDFLGKQHLVTQNPVAGVRAPKSPKTLPAALSQDDAIQMMNIKGEEVFTLRDRAMFELFYSSGLRLSELVNLDPTDIDNGEVRVTGKGNKTRVIPVGAKALEAIKAWELKRKDILKPDETALFIGKTGKRISPRMVQLQIKKWAAIQGIEANMHPHVLRHSFASHMLQASQDLRAVQEMLGHASIASTQVYTHLDFQHLAKVYDSAHPRAKKK